MAEIVMARLLAEVPAEVFEGGAKKRPRLSHVNFPPRLSGKQLRKARRKQQLLERAEQQAT